MTTPVEHARLLIQQARSSGECAAAGKNLTQHIEDLEVLADPTPGDLIGGLLLGTGIAITFFVHATVGMGMIATGIVIFAVTLDAKIMRIRQAKRSIQRGITDLEECIANTSTQESDG